MTYHSKSTGKRSLEALSKKELVQKLMESYTLFDHVLEGTMAGFWDWDIPGDTEYMSPQFKAMFGYEDHEIENHPEAWQRIMHPDDLPGVFEVFNRHIESKGVIPYDNECRYYHKNGSIVWVYCRGKVIEWAPDGSPLRMIGSHVDITELKEKEELAVNVGKLKAKNDALQQFVYVASHDLQEPMRTIKGFADLLDSKFEESLNEDARKYLNIISKSADHLTELVGAVLEYSTLGDSPRSDEVFIDDVLQQVLMDLRLRCEELSATVNVALPRLSIPGYPKELYRLFSNLISNGLKYTKPGERPNLIVSYSVTARFHQIHFKDNGIGIDPKYHERIFQMFQRLHTRDEYKGTGIGLSHCKKIAELHRGSIDVHSEEGKGTTFTLKVPIK